MGTNYYTFKKACKECKAPREAIHLGKSSAGWQFLFQFNGGKFYKNVEEMKYWLSDKPIEDEYGRGVSYGDFWKMVDNKQTDDNLNHSKLYPEGCMVIDGYSFSDNDFS